jgi:cell division protein FtsB
MKILLCALTILLLLVQYQLWFGHGGRLELGQINKDVEFQRIENSHLRERNASLAAEVADLRDGLEAIEERARTDMGMVKTNERFYQIIKRE